VSSCAFLDAVGRQAGTTEHVEHRPWPLPEEPWVQAQTWEGLCFLHWRVDADDLRRLLPESVELDVFDGSAWIALTPFLVTNLRLRGLPPLPRLSSFRELNVRTYVTRDDKPGIWFFSLDASSQLAVEAAKLIYKLPYQHAQIQCERRDDWAHVDACRSGAAFSARYRGEGDLFPAERGSLEAFLVERYCLYTEDGGRLYRADIHHAPWPLQRGEAHVDLNTVAPLALPNEAPHVLFSPRQDTVVWPLHEVDGPP
jgi:uncharacterized protein